MKLDRLDLALPYIYMTGFGVSAFFAGRGTLWLIPIALYCGACALGGAFHVGRYQATLDEKEDAP